MPCLARQQVQRWSQGVNANPRAACSLTLSIKLHEIKTGFNSGNACVSLPVRCRITHTRTASFNQNQVSPHVPVSSIHLCLFTVSHTPSYFIHPSSGIPFGSHSTILHPLTFSLLSYFLHYSTASAPLVVSFRNCLSLLSSRMPISLASSLIVRRRLFRVLVSAPYNKIFWIKDWCVFG